MTSIHYSRLASIIMVILIVVQSTQLLIGCYLAWIEPCENASAIASALGHPAPSHVYDLLQARYCGKNAVVRHTISFVLPAYCSIGVAATILTLLNMPLESLLDGSQVGQAPRA